MFMVKPDDFEVRPSRLMVQPPLLMVKPTTLAVKPEFIIVKPKFWWNHYIFDIISDAKTISSDSKHTTVDGQTTIFDD